MLFGVLCSSLVSFYDTEHILKDVLRLIIYQVTEIISEIQAPIVTVGADDPADARKKELKVNFF